MTTEKARQALESIRGKDLSALTLTDFYWMLAELDRLYDQADQHEAIRQQRALLKERVSSIPPKSGSIAPEPLPTDHTPLCPCVVCRDALAVNRGALGR